MSEIKCPRCGEVFVVDESDYANIVSQVRNEEFHKELHEREQQLQTQQENEIKLLNSKAEIEREKALADIRQENEVLRAKLTNQQQLFQIEKDKLNATYQQQLSNLTNKIENFDKEKIIALNELNNQKKDEIIAKNQQIVALEHQLKESEKDI